MQIDSSSYIRHPVEAVYAIYRDRLPDLAAYLPDVAEIIVRSREERDGGVRLHNEWVADHEVPRVIRPYVRPEHLRWDDHATWYDADHHCEFELRTRAFTEAVDCRGSTTISSAEHGGTRVQLRGELKIDASAVRGVPRLVAGRIGPSIERFIIGLIRPNLERTNTAIQQLLDDEAAGGSP